RLVDDPRDGARAEHGDDDVARFGEHRLLLALRQRPGGGGAGEDVVVGERGHARVPAVAAGPHHQGAATRQFTDGGERRPAGARGRSGVRGRRGQVGGQAQRLVEPAAYVGEPVRVGRRGGGRQPAGRGQVDVVVEEFDDRHGAGQSGAFVEPA